jgi:hypothetical protein
MDPTIALLVAAIGMLSGIGGATITAVLTQRGQQRTKREELAAARDDAHRAKLQQGYADFITAYGAYLDAAADTFAKAHTIVDEAAASAFLQATLAFSAASTVQQQKAMHVTIIDDNQARREQALALSNLKVNPSNKNAEEASNEVYNARIALQALSKELAGAFSPNRWRREQELEQLELDTTAPRSQLGSGS